METNGVHVLRLYGEDEVCFRIPRGLPPDGSNERHLAIITDCEKIRGEKILGEGEVEVWFWLEKVRRFFLKVEGGERLFTMRFWKDVRWFVMSGTGDVEVSAGGLPVRCREDGSVEAFVIKPAGKESYALPKGLIERGETPEETAVREVAEETGMVGDVLDLLGRVNYFYKHPVSGMRIYKEVFYFLLQVREATGRHDEEVERVIPVSIDQLPSILTYDSERKITRNLLEKCKGGEIEVCK